MMNEDYIFKEGNKFIIKRNIGGELITFGSFNTLDDAISYRDDLDNDGWPIPKKQYDNSSKNYDYGQYISKKDNKFIVSRVIRGENKIFGEFETLEEAKLFKIKLIENAWDDVLNYNGKYSKFIHKSKRDNKFVIFRNIFGKSRYFGSYSTFEEALKAREKLIDDNWGVDGKIYYYDPNEYGEFIVFFNDLYRIKNVINGESFEFGKFDTLENATIARDILIENNWDISKVPDNVFSTSFFISYRSFLSLWEISNVINGDLISFGFFSTKQDAEKAVNILIKNDWEISNVPLNLYSPNSFIYKRERYFYIVSKINETLRYHDRFNSYEEARYERDKLLLSNWSIKEEILEEEKFDEYIFLKSDGKYYLKFEDAGRIKVFGIFDDFVEAVDARYECMKNGWNVPYLYEEKQNEVTDLNDEILFDDVKQIFDSVELINEPEIPFPQINSFNKLINISEGLFENIMCREEIIEIYDLHSRQYDFFISAGEYLGLFEKSEKNIFLSTDGLKIFVKDKKEKFLSLINLILQHKPFYDVFNIYLEKNEIPDSNVIFEILKENNIYNITSDVTLKRRASSVKSWIKWIVSLYEE